MLRLPSCNNPWSSDKQLLILKFKSKVCLKKIGLTKYEFPLSWRPWLQLTFCRKRLTSLWTFFILGRFWATLFTLFTIKCFFRVWCNIRATKTHIPTFKGITTFSTNFLCMSRGAFCNGYICVIDYLYLYIVQLNSTIYDRYYCIIFC